MTKQSLPLNHRATQVWLLAETTSCDAAMIANMNRWDATEPNRRLSQCSDSGMMKADSRYPDRFGNPSFVE